MLVFEKCVLVNLERKILSVKWIIIFYKSCELVILNSLIIYSHVYDFDKQLLILIYLTQMYLY